MNKILDGLSHLLADTYTLYLKTQNYHWHVTGPQFKTLHELFEMQYQELAEALDSLAERIVMMGGKAPATFKAFEGLSRIKEGDSSLKANEMVIQLANDHSSLVDELHKVLKLTEEKNDEGSAALLGERIAAHEKARWMLNASRE